MESNLMKIQETITTQIQLLNKDKYRTTYINNITKKPTILIELFVATF